MDLRFSLLIFVSKLGSLGMFLGHLHVTFVPMSTRSYLHKRLSSGRI
jgi:hypothetical protein